MADIVSALKPVPPDHPYLEEQRTAQEQQQQQGAAAGALPAITAPTGGLSTPQLLCQLAAASIAAGGASWRVGVMPPVDERELGLLGPLRDAFIGKQTRAAVMEVDVLVPDRDSLVEEDLLSSMLSDVGVAPGAAPVPAPSDWFTFEGARSSTKRRSAQGGAGSRRNSLLGLPQKSWLEQHTFQEMHRKGYLAVESAAMVEAALGALIAGEGQGAGHRRPSFGQPGGGLRLRLNLWRADMMSAVLEVDAQGTVLSVPHSKLYKAGEAEPGRDPPHDKATLQFAADPFAKCFDRRALQYAPRCLLAGLLFGRDTSSLIQRSLHSLMSLPEGSATSVDALFEQDLKNGKAKRGALKTSRKVLPQVRP